MGPQQLPHRRQIATAQPPALDLGRHPSADLAEHDRAIAFSIKEPERAFEAGVFEVHDQLLRRRRGLDRKTSTGPAGLDELGYVTNQRLWPRRRR
ncbi:MAG: hypothetical protein OXH86_09995 [Acidimicrobiaceae bacterium]|nr:hypothetical protein [Acidimicrobiaceae bacterium]MDE0497674.1 hypothetical protein [Acidimicrobiaceae bacterium]